MALVRVKGKYQVTIPKEVRRKLGLRVGDYLEVEVQGSAILLKPKALLDKDEAFEKLQAVLGKLREKRAALSEEEVEQEVLEAIRAVRSERTGRSRRRLPPPRWGEWPGFGVGRGAVRALPLHSHPR
jgi:AbrB family looped-hinge helix DNA binding protein